MKYSFAKRKFECKQIAQNQCACKTFKKQFPIVPFKNAILQQAINFYLCAICDIKSSISFDVQHTYFTNSLLRLVSFHFTTKRCLYKSLVLSCCCYVEYKKESCASPQSDCTFVLFI
jgi:hypothetical protein